MKYNIRKVHIASLKLCTILDDIVSTIVMERRRGWDKYPSHRKGQLLLLLRSISFSVSITTHKLFLLKLKKRSMYLTGEMLE